MNLLVSLINSYFPEPHASLLNGMLLGTPLFVTNTFYNQLKQVGLIHIVVLSGMNITMLSAILLNTLVYFINRKWAILCTVVIIIFFVLFVGAEPPVVRAGIMGIISLAAVVYGRQTMAIYSLFLSGIIMLMIHIEWLWSISFQLSFGATLGIILFGSMEHTKEITNNKLQDTNKLQIASNKQIPRYEQISNLKSQVTNKLQIASYKQISNLKSQDTNKYSNSKIQSVGPSHSEFISESSNQKILKPVQDDKSPLTARLASRLATYFLEEFRISLAAQVFTVPLIFWYFRQISFVSPLANVLVAWLIAPIMILGMFTIVIGLVSWHLGFVISWIVYPLLGFIVWVVEALSKIPFASIRL